MPKSLENIKVLDFSRIFAGPFCTMLLRDLGAEIIKIEIPEGGETVRTAPPFTEGGESYDFIILNRGKKSVTLDMQSEKGCEICKELAKKADIVVENFTPGVMERLGLGYKELNKINPSLIYASISGFGHTGPRSSEPGFDLVAQAMGGMMAVTGFPDGPPSKAGPSIADFIAGLYGAVAILAALKYRLETGIGQSIDISMQDCIWAITAVESAGFYFLTGENPPRFGNSLLGGGTPFSVYPAEDGYVVICAATVGMFENFLRVIGREDLIGVEKYSNIAERINHRDEVDALVEGWTKTRSVEEILNKLKKAHLPCSSVPTFAEVANDPQLLSREMIIEVEQLLSGKVKVSGSPFKLSETPGDMNFPAAFLGEHNDAVYSNILGYSEEEIRKLTKEGII